MWIVRAFTNLQVWKNCGIMHAAKVIKCSFIYETGGLRTWAFGDENETSEMIAKDIVDFAS